MKLEMTELGPVKRALKIEVPEEAVKSEFQKVYAELKRQVRIPGFRPGKAPLEILQKRYGQMVGQDVVQRLVPDYLPASGQGVWRRSCRCRHSTIGPYESRAQFVFYLYGNGGD